MGEIRPESLVMRTDPRPEDAASVERLATATGMFRADEVTVARELVEARLERGHASGYAFILVDGSDGELIAYACHGPIACTVWSHDLYWIIVDPRAQGRGLGRRVIRAVEVAVASSGGRRIYAETSSLARYEPTRRFYTSCGYRLEAELRDFYGPDDHKCVYVMALDPGPPTGG